MIKKQNDIVEEAEDIFYEVLDIIGHDVVPCYKVDGNEFHSPEWESRFGDNIEYINEELLYEYYAELDGASGKEVETMIVYQPACDSNNWVPAKLDERLMLAIKSLEERYSSIGCALEYETSTLNMKGGEKGIWTISVADKMEIIDRSTLTNHEFFGEIMRRESHHDQPIELRDGIPR